MMRTDFHTHTTYCDGRSSAEEMVQAAVEKQMDCIGFSGHALTSFDTEWCMSADGMRDYVQEIRRLKEKYDGRIRIFCGAEWDYYSDGPREGLEYTIGSVHYIEKDGRRVNVDESPALLKKLCREWYEGDIYTLIESYYRNVSDVLDRTGADIVGHFDLVTKFNEDGSLFDESHPRYRVAWQQAADRLLGFGKPFEINTGAISRGYRSVPYPSAEIMEYLAFHGARFILSSDSHHTSTLLYGFDRWERYAREHGFTLVSMPDCLH